MWFTYWLLVHRLCSATLDSCNLPFGLAHLYSRAFSSVRCCQRTWYVMGKTFDFSDHVVRDDFAGKPFYVPSKILSHSARRLIQMIVSILLFVSRCSFWWKKIKFRELSRKRWSWGGTSKISGTSKKYGFRQDANVRKNAWFPLLRGKGCWLLRGV